MSVKRNNSKEVFVHIITAAQKLVQC